jgi:AraC-like DNA-binding protein
MHLQTKDTAQEWSHYYHFPHLYDLEALHAQFVGHRYVRHTHEYFVIALVDSGAASYWYRGAQRLAGSGQVFIVNPDEPHTGDPAAPGGYIYRVLYPRVEHLADIAAEVAGRHIRPFFSDSILRDDRLSRLLSRFHASLAQGTPTANCEALLFHALTRLLTCHSSPHIAPQRIGRELPAIKTACEYIRAHFAEEVSISKLAKLTSLSPYYFARAFEQEIGLPPHTYLENVRIQKTREFLDEGQPLASAALLAGFVDQSHFTNRFKRFLGITPGQYARNRTLNRR